MNSYDDYEKLADFGRNVTIKSQEGQIWINRGLMQFYGFNHYEAIRCFKKALEYDPCCGFAHWGIAYCLGPHYNKLEYESNDYLEASKHLDEAINYIFTAEDWERDLIVATKKRYPAEMPVGDEVLVCLNSYANEMKEVYKKHPNDQDIGSICAEAIMNLRPWQLWMKSGEPYPEALEARVILEKVISKGPHPLAYHLYIHLLELSPYVKDALKVADELYEIGTGVGHLLHMPTHIYVQLGDYQKSINCNIKGVEADNQVAKRIGIFNFYSFYRCHNVDFLIWAAMFLGDFDTAFKYSEILKTYVNEDLVNYDGANMEFFYSVYMHVLIRFGKWDEILNVEIEKRDGYYIHKVMQRYARCIAFGVKGMISESEEELKHFNTLKEKEPNKRYGNNPAKSVFDIAEQMALGELEYRKKNYEKAFDHLRRSVVLCDDLIYDEPWNWPQPTRHALGALLLEQGHSVEAEAVYRKDMDTYPDNIWSLSGLQECLKKNGKIEESEHVAKKLEAVKLNAVKEIKFSCFCRKDD